MSVPIPPRSRWTGRKPGGQADRVVVEKITSAGKVVIRRPDGDCQSFPVNVFLEKFQADTRPHVCRNCGSSDLDGASKWCRKCLPMIMAANNKRKANGQKEDDVLTTTDSKVIEQKRQEASVSQPPPAPPPPPRRPVTRWEVTGRRYVEERVVYEATGVRDAAAQAEAEGFEVTDVHRLDP